MGQILESKRPTAIRRISVATGVGLVVSFGLACIATWQQSSLLAWIALAVFSASAAVAVVYEWNLRRRVSRVAGVGIVVGTDLVCIANWQQSSLMAWIALAVLGASSVAVVISERKCEDEVFRIASILGFDLIGIAHVQQSSVLESMGIAVALLSSSALIGYDRERRKAERSKPPAFTPDPPASTPLG
jgi:hypothetical protein